MRCSGAFLLSFLVISPASASLDAGEPRYASEEALRRYGQGRLLEEQGSRPSALDEYYRALFLDPKAAEVARRVSEVAAVMGDPGRSLEFAERALVIDPHDARALWLKGAALLNLGRDRDALAPLAAAVEADSTRAEYFRTLARAAERLDQVDLLAQSYRRVIWLDEEDGEAWFQLASAEARRGRFGAADTAVVVAAEMNPLRPGLYFLRGWIAENRGRLDEAREDYMQHLEIHRDDQGTRRRLTLLLARQERYRDALIQTRIMAEALPKDLPLRHLEADLAFQVGDKAEGQRLLDRIRDEFPDDLETQSARLSILARHGRGKQAITEADRWLDRHPEDLHARLMVAQVHDAGGDAKGAVERLRQAVAEVPDSLAPRVLLARVLVRADRNAEAEPVWAEAHRRFPDQNGIAFDLALCREKLGDLDGAEVAVRDVLAREPNNATALNFLGYLFADHNRKLNEAVDLIQRALSFEPDNGAFMDSLGWAYYRLGRFADARIKLERAVELSGGDPVIHEHLGDVYKDMRLNDLAKDQYRKCLSFDRTNERVRAKLSSIR